jgi:hypothetical protein
VGFIFGSGILKYLFPVKLELAFLATFWSFQCAVEPGSVTEYESSVEQKGKNKHRISGY